MKNTPLSRLTAPSPLSLRAARFGKGDNASARYKPEHGVRWAGLRRGRFSFPLWGKDGMGARPARYMTQAPTRYALS